MDVHCVFGIIGEVERLNPLDHTKEQALREALAAPAVKLSPIGSTQPAESGRETSLNIPLNCGPMAVKLDVHA